MRRKLIIGTIVVFGLLTIAHFVHMHLSVGHGGHAAAGATAGESHPAH